MCFLYSAQVVAAIVRSLARAKAGFNGVAIDSFRFETLDFFVDLARRVEVAA